MRWLILFLIFLNLPLVLSINNETSVASAGNNESFAGLLGNAEISAFVIGQGVSITAASSNGTSEAAVTPATTSSDSNPKLECTPTDKSACDPDESCFNFKCVKLFDVKILEFESPATLGDFFDFIYLLKGMAEINNDVKIEFWIEDSESKVITSGSDVIYMGNYEEKRETAKIFLPKEVKSGIYKFFVKVTFEDYSASSFRTIEIAVKPGEGIAEIKDVESKFPIPLIVIIIILVLLLVQSKMRHRGLSRRAEEIHQNRLAQKISKSKHISPGLHILADKMQRSKKHKETQAKLTEIQSTFKEVKEPKSSLAEKKKIAGSIDTKEELDEMLDRMEKKTKDPKEKPF